jgi:hypothetical protein
VCTSDYIAFVACDALHKAGYRVPEDVIVTGFGGVPYAEHFSPRLTTCSQDLAGLAERTLAAVQEAIAGNSVTAIELSPYRTIYAESCGCQSADREDVRTTICHLYRTIGEMAIHEDVMYSWIDRVLGMEDMNGLYPALSRCVLDDSCVCLEAGLFQLEGDEAKPGEGQLTVIPAANLAKTPGDTLLAERNALVPGLTGWATNDALCIVSAIYAGNRSCGY